MNRDYKTGTADNVVFFIGQEVEKTSAYGLKTLFVTGLQSNGAIEALATDNQCFHIFFGANHSYINIDRNASLEWDQMITYFLVRGYKCSLDIPMSEVEMFNEGGLNEYNNFIPQIRVPLPYIKLWNYNTMIKIDDIGFNATNPGVWTHSLHDLMNRDSFTEWNQYKNDEIV